MPQMQILSVVLARATYCYNYYRLHPYLFTVFSVPSIPTNHSIIASQEKQH
jgi:hypothetical protein